MGTKAGTFGRSVVLVALLGTVDAITDAAVAASGLTTRVSVRADGGQAFAPSSEGSISNAGDVAFTTPGDLVVTDSNRKRDVYIKTAPGQTLLLSRNPDGNAGNGASDSPSISANGRFVAFRSSATDIVPGGADTNGASDVFLYDRDPVGNGVDNGDYSVTRQSVNSGGQQGDASSDSPSVSVSGTAPYVAFRSSATNLAADFNDVADIFVRYSNTTRRVSVDSNNVESNGPSHDPDIAASATQVFVAFESDADNLSHPDDSNGIRDVFLHALDLGTSVGTTARVSLTAAGKELSAPTSDPSVSSDGLRVLFTSDVATLVSGDTNGVSDVFVKNIATAAVTRVSVTSGGVQGDGRSDSGRLSDDGQVVAFRSFASNLVAGDTNGMRDVFVRRAGTDPNTQRVSLGATDSQSAGRSFEPAVAGDGSAVAFTSDASDLIGAGNDTNGVNDVFLRRQDVVAPNIPTATPDAQHVVHGPWSGDTTITMSVSATDPQPAGAFASGVAGFSYVFDAVAATIPDTTVDIAGAPTDITSASQPTGSRYFHVRAVDGAGNVGPTRHAGPFRVDATPPSDANLADIPSAVGFSLTTSLSLSWSASDADSGLANYDVMYERAAVTRAAAGSEPPVVFLSKTTATSAPITVAVGYDYQFWVRAYDNVGNFADSPKRGVSIPVDDRSLTRSAGWATVTSPSYYGGSATQTKTTGATLTFNARHIFGFGLVVTKCPTCGSVEVFINGTSWGDISLVSATTEHQRIPNATFFPERDPALIELKVTSASGALVRIDGLGLARPS